MCIFKHLHAIYVLTMRNPNEEVKEFPNTRPSFYLTVNYPFEIISRMFNSNQ